MSDSIQKLITQFSSLQSNSNYLVDSDLVLNCVQIVANNASLNKQSDLIPLLQHVNQILLKPASADLAIPSLTF